MGRSSSCSRAAPSRSASGPENRVGFPGPSPTHSCHSSTVSPGGAILRQVGPQQGGLLLRRAEVQLISAGLHGQAQLLHGIAVVCVGLDGETVLLHRNGTDGPRPADTGVIQGKRVIGTQQGDCAHGAPPKSVQTRPLLNNWGRNGSV